MLIAALKRPKLFPRTSSLGRLFDAVAALCGLGDTVSFEGQAAMQLEFATDESETAAYNIQLADSTPFVADWGPMLQGILDDQLAGMPTGRIAARFHNSLAQLALSVARRVGCPRIVLTGGCFQNRLLTERTRLSLSKAGFEVYTQRLVPAGDGGLSLGQVLGAIQQVGEK